MAHNELDERLNRLRKALVEEALFREWQYKYAKFAKTGTQSLLVHAINTFSVARIIGRVAFELADDEMLVACASGFLHDIQKARESWQTAARAFMVGGGGPKEAFSHDDGSPEAKIELGEFVDKVDGILAPAGMVLKTHLDRLLNIVVYTHDAENPSVASRRRRQVGPIDPLAGMVRFCDSIASIKAPEDVLANARDPDLPAGKSVAFEYHEISSIRGIVSSFLNQALIRLMENAGYEPMLYFGNGVAYVGSGNKTGVENPERMLQKLIEEQFDAFQGSEVYEQGLVSAVLGPVTQTTWPCIQFVREKDIPGIFRHLSSLPAMNQSNASGDGYFERKSGAPEYKKALEGFVLKIGLDTGSVLAMMNSDFNLLIYFADFLKQYRALIKDEKTKEEFGERVDSWLKNQGIAIVLQDLRDVSNTTPATRRAEVIELLWGANTTRLYLDKDRRTKLERGFVAVLRKVISAYGQFLPPLLSEDVKNALMNDVHHLPLPIRNSAELVRFSHETYGRYLTGKAKKKRICSLCGAPSEDDAATTLFGDGAQMFSNFLPAGTTIGAGHKAQVCPVCSLEACLRGFYFPKSEAVLLVIPDLSLSPGMQASWSNAVNEYVIMEKLGLSTARVWNMRKVYRILAKGKSINSVDQLVRFIEPTGTAIDNLSDYLEEQVDIKLLDYRVIRRPPESQTYRALARAHLVGDIQIDSRYLRDYKSPTRVQGTCYITPSYTLIFYRNRPYENEKEAESTIALRTYLMALITAVAFHARVIYSEGFHPIADLSVDGFIRIPLPAPAEVALRRLGVNPTTLVHEAKDVLRKLAAASLISTDYVEGLGKDRLLRLMSMNRGAILRRAQIEAKNASRKRSKPRLLDLLEQMPAFADYNLEVSSRRDKHGNPNG